MRHIHLNHLLPAALLLAVGLPLAASSMDNRIEASAKSSYNFKTYLKGDPIKVECSGGVVTLTGSVSEEWHKSLAEETVSDLPGVKSVHNQISVADGQPAEHSDGWVTMKVKSALLFHKHVSGTDTQVNTQNGVVTLSGSADSDAQKQLTGEYAKDVEGVKDVRNDLSVSKPAKAAHEGMGAKVDDASITAQIKTTLLFHKSTHSLATKVVTKNGMVTLHGEAENAAERDLAAKLAADIEGVKHVDNRMTVEKS
ncbi:MAG TPA: BON domain-containing protein [Holophagaceae bacterium]|jgi:osmotically-inducible protein OsmY|nr:BON domain-containing protein [Holophagaceae bacterium]